MYNVEKELNIVEILVPARTQPLDPTFIYGLFESDIDSPWQGFSIGINQTNIDN